MATKFDTLLLGKIETTKGTDSVPVPATDAVRSVSFSVKKNTTLVERKLAKQTMGNMPHAIGRETVAMEIVVELRGSGAAGTPPEYDPLIQACRHVVTTSAGVSNAYKPSTLTEKTATIYAYKDGLLWKLLGAVGDMKIDSSIEGIVTLTFSMQGIYTAPTAVTVPTGAVYDSTQPVVMNNTSVFTDGAAIGVSKFALAAGNSVDSQYTTMTNTFEVGDRNPSLTFTKDSVSTVAEWTALSAGTPNAAFSGTLGTAAGNRLVVTASNAIRKDVVSGERGNRTLLDVTYGLYETASDDQYTFLFN